MTVTVTVTVTAENPQLCLPVGCTVQRRDVHLLYISRSLTFTSHSLTFSESTSHILLCYTGYTPDGDQCNITMLFEHFNF